MEPQNENKAKEEHAAPGLDIESTCQHFRNEATDIKEFIESEPQVLKNERLCLRLIQCDIERKRQMGHSPNASDYSELFPDLDRQSIRDLMMMPEPPPADLTGPLLPKRYRPIKEIGAGGIGNVWRVFDKTLERPLAVKVLHQKFRHSPAANARLDREAMVTGLLQHPGIPPIHDRGKLVTGSSFFAMKLVDGETLAEILDSSDFREKRMQLIGIFEQIAQTIAYAHTQKVVHRDLKPANVMVGEFGEVQVMDWGMAKVLDAHSRPTSKIKSTDANFESSPIDLDDASLAETILRTNDSSISEPQRDLTQQGDVIGTPTYMAPEQASGKLNEISPASDVFSLGAILLELLTGKPLYSDVPDESLIAAAASGAVDDSLARLKAMNLDADLFELTRDCLARNPEARPANGSEVAKRVTSYLHSVEARLRESELSIGKAEVKLAEERKRKRLAFGLVATILLSILVVAAVYSWFQHQAQKQEIANQKSQAKTLVLAVGSAPIEELELSISNLMPFEGMAKAALLSELEKVDDPELKTRYAIALAHFQDLRIPLLVGKLQEVDDAMVFPIINALANDRENSANELEESYGKAKTRNERIRLVVASIAMKDQTLLKKFVFEPAENEVLENQRFGLIHAYRSWHGSITPIWDAYQANDDEALRFVLLSSIAEVPYRSVNKNEINSIATDLSIAYANEKTASLRALIELVLKRWKIEIPSIAPTNGPRPGFDWYATTLGNILIHNRIEYRTTGVNYEYYISDREITASLFQQFIQEDTEAAERRIVLGSSGLDRMWEGKTFKDVVNGAIHSSCDNGQRDANESPMTCISFYTALRFCNWMSRKEGLEPCYINLDPVLEKSTIAFDPRAENWVKNHGANGYRLPEVMEFSQAAAPDSNFRLNKTDAQYHALLGWYSKNTLKSQSVASCLPNTKGLFDVYGNLSEIGDLRDANSGRLYLEYGGSFLSPSPNHEYKSGAWPSPTITTDNDSGIRVVRMTKQQIQTRANGDRAYALKVRYSETHSVDESEKLEKLADDFSREGLSFLRNGPVPFADLCFSYSRQIATRLIERDFRKAEMLELRGGACVNAAIANRSMKLFDRAFYLLELANEDLKAAIALDRDVKYARSFLDNCNNVKLTCLTQQASRLSTDMNPNKRDGEKAVRLAKQAVAMKRDISTLSVLAASYAERKDFDKAIEVQEEVLSLLTDSQKREKTVHRVRLKKFQEKKPLRFRQ